MSDDQPQGARDTLAGRVFMAPADGGDWKQIGTTDGFALTPKDDDDEKVWETLVPAEHTLEVTFVDRASVETFRRLSQQADAIERSKAILRAATHEAAVLAIVEEWRTTYIVTTLLQPMHMHYVRAEALADVIERHTA